MDKLEVQQKILELQSRLDVINDKKKDHLNNRRSLRVKLKHWEDLDKSQIKLL